MKQTKHFCDRCKEDCGVDGDKVYPERLRIIRNEDDDTEKCLELCGRCAKSFDTTVCAWFEYKFEHSSKE